MTCRTSFLGNNLKGSELQKATGIGMVTQALVLIMGPIILMTSKDSLPIATLALINSISYIISALIIMRLPNSEIIKNNESNITTSNLSSYGILTKEFAPLRQLIIGSGVILAIISILVPFIGIKILEGHRGIQLAQFVYVIGLLVIGIFAPKAFSKFRLSWYTICGFSTLLVLLLGVIFPFNVFAILALLVMGIVAGSLDFLAYMFIQENTADDLRGRTISTIMFREKIVLLFSLFGFSYAQQTFGFNQVMILSLFTSGILLLFVIKNIRKLERPVKICL
jgi:hypothetical protein